MTQPVLQLENLSVSFDTPLGEVEAVRDVSLSLNAGEILGIVGESGCGKTVMSQAVMKLLPKSSKIKQGRIIVDGVDITNYKEKQMKKLRGSVLSMVFQDPMTTLNPTIPVGKQITESILKHNKIKKKQAKLRALEMLNLVGINDSEHMFNLQPQFFSGGMRQRCVLAIALASNPKVLFADEATTALDVTVQVKIIDLLLDIREKTGISIVFISHNLGTVARIADRVAVMYAGKIIEIGTSEEIFYDPRHPYLWGLMSALPSMTKAGENLANIPGMPPVMLDPPHGDAFAVRNKYALAIDYEKMPPMFPISPTHSAATWLLDERAPQITPPILQKTDSKNRSGEATEKKGEIKNPEEILRICNLKQHFHINSDLTIKAVDGVSFQINKGEVFGVVGETGSGKSTVARTIMGIYPVTSGEVYFKGNRISDKKVYKRYSNDIHKNLQIIFQDSAAALNPRMTVEQIISEPLKVNGVINDKNKLREKVESLLLEVGLDNSYKSKYPTEISGGQRQRVAIARCLSTSPDLIIADEPIASLDVSIQAQIITLFQCLQRERGFSFILIAHDLSIIQYICDKVGVMLRGKLVEIAETKEIFENPLHPYTKSLLSAVPVPDPVCERSKEILHYDTKRINHDEELVEVSPGHYVLMDTFYTVLTDSGFTNDAGVCDVLVTDERSCVRALNMN